MASLPTVAARTAFGVLDLGPLHFGVRYLAAAVLDTPAGLLVSVRCAPSWDEDPTVLRWSQPFAPVSPLIEVAGSAESAFEVAGQLNAADRGPR